MVSPLKNCLSSYRCQAFSVILRMGLGFFGLVCFWLGGSFVFVCFVVFLLIMTVEILVKKIAIQ